MTYDLEIQVLVWGRHKNVVGLNQLMGHPILIYSCDLFLSFSVCKFNCRTYIFLKLKVMHSFNKSRYTFGGIMMPAQKGSFDAFDVISYHQSYVMVFFFNDQPFDVIRDCSFC
jgi:hypothetical protein